MTPNETPSGISENETPARQEIDKLLVARAAARAAKDWIESDRLRDALKAAGVQVIDRGDDQLADAGTEFELRFARNQLALAQNKISSLLAEVAWLREQAYAGHRRAFWESMKEGHL